MTLVSYHMDKRRLLKGVAGFALFLIAAIASLLHEGHRSSTISDVFIFTSIVVPCLAMLQIGLSGLFAFRPAIEITEDCIRWNVSWMSKGRLLWSQVRSVSCINFGGTWFVKLEPDDMAAFVAQQPWPRRILYRVLIRYDWPVTPTCVPGSGLRDGSAGAIAKHARRRIRALAKRPSQPLVMVDSA